MSLYKEIGRFIVRRAKKDVVISSPAAAVSNALPLGAAPSCGAGTDSSSPSPVNLPSWLPAVPEGLKPAPSPTGGSGSLASRVWRATLFPSFFKFVRAPFERWQFASMTKYLRDHGLMFDDLYSNKEPVVERALQMLPHDIAMARQRRMMRGVHLNHLRLYLPPEEQNYDPFIPYLAPYIEEAKFQLQEEEELLGFHMQDRRLFSGGCTGFGDLEPGLHFLVGIPNLYGAGGGVRNSPMGGKHFSSNASPPSLRGQKRPLSAVSGRLPISCYG